MSTIKLIPPPSTRTLYFQVLLFSILVFGCAYGYTAWLKIPNVLNKSVADTAIILIGLSMLLSSICYFWNFLDPLIRYRKYLGLVGWAFGLAHLALSFSSFQALLKAETWDKGLMWPAITGLVATAIFTVMAIISNSHMAQLLGGKWWRALLRTGYVAVIFVLIHVVLLKSARWIVWYQAGMHTWPSMSLLATAFMLVVLIMRLILWISLKKRRSPDIVRRK